MKMRNSCWTYFRRTRKDWCLEVVDFLARAWGVYSVYPWDAASDKRLDVTSVILWWCLWVVLQKAWLLILKIPPGLVCLVSGAGKQQRSLLSWLNFWQVPKLTWWTVRTSFRLFLTSYNVPSWASDVLLYARLRCGSNGATRLPGKEGARQDV